MKVPELVPQKGPSGATIADWIRHQIRSQRMVPGQRLVEVDIIRQTGGSRFKVREALQRLAAEGLVEIEEFRGASVRNASMDEVRQLYRARAALEGLCAADFTRRASPEQKEELARLAEEMEECVAGAHPELFSRLNSQWHNFLMETAGNGVIQEIVHRLNTPIHHLVFESFYRGDRLRNAVQDHRDIVNAVLAGDDVAAEAAMRRHVTNGWSYLSELDRNIHSSEI